MSRFVVLAALLIAACASSTPAPISYGGSPPQSAARPLASPASRDAIAEGLAAYGLRPDEVQPLGPGDIPRTHRVAQGESAYDIAVRYQIPLNTLLEMNRLSSAAVRPGVVLTLPQHDVHVVERGETLRDIANRYEVDPRSLALLNRIEPNHQVQPGDRIYLPYAGGAQPPPAAAPAAAAERGDETHGAWRWPLRGAVLTQFGVHAGGVRSDAMEIGGEEGAPVSAAADGEVIYAGQDLPAYGVLVLVRHGDDLVSTYGYLRRAAVRVGQQVRAGENLGELDARPDGGSRLLFQVRRHGRLIDPGLLLPAAE